MDEAMTKALLLEQIEKERRALEALLAQVPAERLDEPGVEGNWSVKDILAHIVVWEQRMVRWLDETRRGEVPEMLLPGWTEEDVDRWNEQTYRENRDRPLAEVLADFAQSYEQDRRDIAAVPEADLLDPARFPWWDGKPLWLIVASNTNWHYAEHATAIQSWLRQGGLR